MEKLNDQQLELMILGDIYRDLELSDRLPGDILACESLNWELGVPDSANDLLATAHQLHGEALVRESFLSPDTFALSHLRSTCDACGYCLTQREHLCTQGPLLSRKQKLAWSREEFRAYSDLKARIQNLFRRWEARGLIDRVPPVLYTGNAAYERAAPDKDTWAARITTRGIALARAVVPGTEFAKGPKSLCWAMDPSQRKRAPQWMQKEFLEEGGTLE